MTKFHATDLVEWMEEVEKEGDVDWIVEDFIPKDNLVLISGEPKAAKKTWLAMLQAMVAAGGLHVGPFKSKRSHKVLYIYREGARRSTLRRFKVIAKGAGFSTEVLRGKFHFMHRGEFWLDKREWVDATSAYIAANGIELVFIDTFAKSMQGDENKALDMNAAVHAAGVLRDKGATIVLVHHLRKASAALTNDKEGSPEPDKDLRGSSALAGAYETHQAIRSYTLNPGEPPTRMLIVGGKEAELTYYNYEWKFFTDAAKELDNVKLYLNLIPEEPVVRLEKEDDEDNLK